ncbi:MAG: 2,3-bisphosphoglycerate-independent phosphoglycerate mutase [Candidatus Moranbacteria bacterium]|nr:2,3-bisphosphoglycerate-independent phosphoglycerate mutase [Candidatus Moranbacteria bacterium]MDD3964726.1 2,3-bisphosphoglycerate-independent phosphoglycerate mutase [Candidatus Moranbacteria bacterium]
MYKPLVLIVLDGWGISNNTVGNPIREATLPTFDKLNRFYPMTTLQASGISVGLPWNTAGNSEVGHMTMGAGRVLYQNLPRISLAIQDGSFYKNETLLKTLQFAKEKKGKLHIMGLVSSGSVHSHKDHIMALLRLAKNENMEEVYIHAFTDGRDSAPNAGMQQLKELERTTRLIGIGKIASLSGRNFSMDRNNNWDRIEKTYRMLTEGTELTEPEPPLVFEKAYAKNLSDEYIEPINMAENGKPIALIENNDAVIFFNFREDRARELTQAFALPQFEGFERTFLDIAFITLTEYENGLPVSVAFPPEDVNHCLGEELSLGGKTQLRVAETEKYAHVTYFFNGGKEKAFPGEDRLLIPSPDVSHFDEIPEMSSPKITETIVSSLKENRYDFILVNYANPDMVAHTGNEVASIQAVEATDKSLSILIPAVLSIGGAILMTADHGNVEELKKVATGEMDTEHSTNPIPLWYITPDNHREKTSEIMMREQNEVNGLLSDVAPTVLDIMGLEKPQEMNGNSLLSILE